MSDRDDDVLELSDVREWLDDATGGVRDQRVAVAIVLAVVGASLAFALVPHTLGAVGSDAVDGSNAPSEVRSEEVQQRYQNYITNVAIVFAPSLVVLVACVAAFVGATRTDDGANRTRWRHVAVVAVAAGVGAALGYAVIVLVGHLAFGETSEGFIVDEFPVTVRLGTLAVNALAIAVASTVGGALAGGAGTLLSDAGGAAVDADEAFPATDDADTDDGGTDDDRTWRGIESDGSEEDTDDVAPDATTDATDRVETADRASDYQETGTATDSDTPNYDPDDRNWDGSGGGGGG